MWGAHREQSKAPGSFHFSPNLLSANGLYRHTLVGAAAAGCRGSVRDREGREHRTVQLPSPVNRRVLKKKRATAERAPWPGTAALYMTTVLEDVRTPHQTISISRFSPHHLKWAFKFSKHLKINKQSIHLQENIPPAASAGQP